MRASHVDHVEDVVQRVTYVATAVVVVIIVVWYLSNPHGLGLTMLASAIGMYSVFIGVGPWLRHARPTYAWLPVTAGATCFLVGLALPGGMVLTSSFAVADAVYVTGYLCFFAALLMMTWHVGRGVAARAVLDAVAAGVAVALVSWTITCVQSGPPAIEFSPSAVYPILDVVMVGLAAHLVVRLGRVVTAWLWIFVALWVLLVVDVTRAVLAALSLAVPPALTVGYLLAYAALALAATHPSVKHLSVVPSKMRAGDGAGARMTVLGVTVALAIGAMIVPLQGARDGAVRALLVALLLGLIFARHAVIGADLAHAVTVGAYRATHDDLTGLLTRAALVDDLRRRLSPGEGSGAPTAVILLACGQLAHAKETWGQSAGDDMLRQVATELRACAEPASTLGRYGDDVFAVLMAASGPHDVHGVLERLRGRLSQGVPVGLLQQYRVTVSSGMAIAHPAQRLSPATVLGQASMALDDARSQVGERDVAFDAEVEERALTQARLAAALREAVAREDFTLDFQPIYTGPGYRTLAGWEALVRWSDAGLGPVSPVVFIPLAESLGLIDDIGRLVMRRACAELKAMRESFGRDDLVVSVNASAPQLDRPDFADFVATTLRESGLSGDALWLEITESLAVDRGPQVIRTLHAMRGYGVQVCIDDFGTGYASLETLLRLPVDGVKIDRAVVSSLCDGSTGRLGHLLDLLRSMGIMHVVAEGIETDEQRAIMWSLGCPFVQGYLLGRPQSPANIRHCTGRLSGASRSRTTL